MSVAVIPARGGSKRIPRKNIKFFSGVPMIAFAIKAAMESGLFEHIVVSTDDAEIADLAKQFGAEVPFFRPPELANDLATTVPVIAHAIQECEKLRWNTDFVCCIYPCVPFLSGADLVSGWNAIEKVTEGYCYPITEFPSPIQRALRLNANGRLQPVQPEYEWTRTQDLEPFYHDAGQFYWGRRQSWLTGLGLQSHGHGVIVPQWRVVDIDTADDWRRAELMFTSRGDASGEYSKPLAP